MIHIWSNSIIWNGDLKDVYIPTLLTDLSNNMGDRQFNGNDGVVFVVAGTSLLYLLGIGFQLKWRFLFNGLRCLFQSL